MLASNTSNRTAYNYYYKICILHKFKSNQMAKILQ